MTTALTEKVLDPITYEVIRHRIGQINDEMASTLMNTSGSELVYEAKDLQVMIQNAKGDGLASGEYIMGHIMMPSPIIKHILKEYSENPGIHDGDIFLNNDSYIGALHPQDSVMVGPLFWEGELICWFGATIHDEDVGGPVPGSWCFEAQTIWDDPPYFPPMKIVDREMLRKDVLAIWSSNSRTPDILDQNVRARMAAILAGRRRMTETIRKYGVEAVKATIKRISDDAESQFRARLLELPDGSWQSVGYVEYGSAPELHAMRLTMTKKADQLTFDFTGTAKNIPGGRNISIHATHGGIAMALLPGLCWDMSWATGGIWRCLEVVSEPGTIVHSMRPAPTTEGLLTSWGVANMVTSCIGGLLGATEKYRERANATWCGLGGGAAWLGLNQFGAMGFGGHAVHAENGGGGAYASRDGVNTAGYIMAAAPCCGNVEMYEAIIPVLYLFWKESPDSGGPGKFRGGLGPQTAYILHDAQGPTTHMSTSWGIHNPQGTGISGGYAASTMRQLLVKGLRPAELLSQGKAFRGYEDLVEEAKRVGAVIEPLNTVTIVVPEFSPDDVGLHIGSGGGGYGDPIDREPERVLADVAEGLVSLECARDIYGVALQGQPLRVDYAETDSMRSKVRADRLK